MNAADFQLGTVAWISVDGVGSFKAIRIVGSRGPVWAHSADETGQVIAADARVTDVRPLVVLDPDDARHCITALRRAREAESSVTAMLTIGHVINQIEAQTKPPRIPEPGLWGVVTARLSRDADVVPSTFVRDAIASVSNWTEIGAADHWTWDDLVDPVLVRDGVEDTP